MTTTHMWGRGSDPPTCWVEGGAWPHLKLHHGSLQCSGGEVVPLGRGLTAGRGGGEDHRGKVLVLPQDHMATSGSGSQHTCRQGMWEGGERVGGKERRVGGNRRLMSGVHHNALVQDALPTWDDFKLHKDHALPLAPLHLGLRQHGC